VRRYFGEPRLFEPLMVARLTAGCALLALLALCSVSAAQARTAAPRLTGLRCVPASTPACGRAVRIAAGRQVQLIGRGLFSGMRVTFRWPRGALATKLRRSAAGWTAQVPAGTAVGRVGVTVRDRAGRRSNTRNIIVVGAPSPLRPVTSTSSGMLPAVMRGHGMWIWQLPKSNHGDLDAIAARARGAGMTTVYVKGSDAGNVWTQFTPKLVQDLHARGLRVCAWQFVYGSNPLGEAAAAVANVQAGADCLIIDAETTYEGRYAAAQRYVTSLRAKIGPSYPLGLTSFPYVDYHPSFPYSVFLAPGAAQANLPQVYWKAIGGSVDAVSAKTVAQNRVYGSPMAPLGQAYGGVTPAEVQRFRAIWAGYGAGGLSWWSWQEATSSTWSALAPPPPPKVVPADPGWPALRKGSRGDQVLWLQQHLATFDAAVEVTAGGRFDGATDTVLRAFQTARGLRASGVTDAATWLAVLALPLRAVDWTAGR
jgi:peptidoglycan hydrolase-like protein with peptidoglycan-binding domain